jgi:hypothetical protein
MSIVLIYHHEERDRTDDLRAVLEQKGYEVELAPLGFAVGSDEWKQAVVAQFKAADAMIGLMTQKAVADEWFVWRMQMAARFRYVLIPVKLESCEMPRELIYMQSARIRDAIDPGAAYVDVLDNLQKMVRSQFCFISYSRSDTDFAVKLVNDLRAKGLKVWRDGDNIPAGASWDLEIQKALSKCTHLLLVATPRSVESPNVADEIGYALNKQKTVIPLMLETCDLPMRVHRAQWVDFRGDYDAALAALVTQLG